MALVPGTSKILSPLSRLTCAATMILSGASGVSAQEVNDLQQQLQELRQRYEQMTQHAVFVPVICYLYILFYGLSGSRPNSERYVTDQAAAHARSDAARAVNLAKASGTD